MVIVNTVDVGRPYSVISLVSGEGGGSEDKAIQAMIQRAANLGADAVVNVRISYTAPSGIVKFFLAYGTAVKFT